MYNDEFDSNANHSDRKETPNPHYKNQGEGRNRSSGSQKKYQDDDGDHPPHKPREKQKTTAIALSVITCLFMCVIGYEIIRENGSKEEVSAPAKEKRPSLISQRSALQDDLALEEHDNEEEVYESYQVRLLKEQNKQQAAKIKALRSELLERMQNMHETKASLFKQESDPRDKAKISELSLKLTDRESSNQQLGLKIRSLESDISELTRKITHLEVTRDALAAMLENQRSSKEQELQTLKKQHEEQQKTTTFDKSDQDKKIQLLEATQQHLTLSLEQKTAALTHLEQELVDHKSQLSDKHEQLVNLSNNYTNSNDEIRQDIQRLVDNLEWEYTSKAIIEKKLQQAIAHLEEELLMKNSLLAVKNEELDNQSNLHKVVDEHTKDEVIVLITSLEWEVTQAHLIQQTLTDALQEQNNQLEQKGEQIKSLESQLSEHRKSLSAKNQHMVALADLYAFSENQIHSNIQHLATSHGIETAKSTQLQQDLEHSRTNQSTLVNELRTMQVLLAASEQRTEELVQELANREINVAAHQLQLQALLESKQVNDDSTKEKIAKLNDGLENELSRVEQLQQNLETAVAQHEIEKNRATALEKQLGEILQQGTNLQVHLTSTNQSLNVREQEIESLKLSKVDLEDKLTVEIEKLTKDIDLERQNGEALVQKLEHSLALYEQDKYKINDLEDKIAHLNELLNNKENELNSVHSKLADTHPQLEQALAENKQLVEEKAQAKELEEKYQDILSSYEAEQKNAHELEQQLSSLAEQLRAKESELDAAQTSINETSSKLVTLAHDNNQLMQMHTKANVLEQQHNEHLAKSNQDQEKIQDLQEQISQLSIQLQSKEDEAEALERKHNDHLAKSGNDQDHITSLQEQISQLSAQLQTKENELDSLQGHLHIAQSDKEDSHHKSELLETKFNETLSQYHDKHQKLQEVEQSLTTLIEQLQQKEQALHDAEARLEETTPQLSLLLEEKQQLMRDNSNYQAKYHESNQELSSHQETVHDLSNELSQTKQALDSLRTKYEEQKGIAQRLERKLQSASLKSTVLEDELTVNKVTLENKQNAIQSLKSSESSLKTDFIQQLSKLTEELDKEKAKAATVKTELESLIDNYQNERDRSASLNEALQRSAKAIGDLEDELSSQKEVALNKERQIQEHESYSVSVHESHRSQVDELRSALEQERINNQSLQSEIKSLLAQYLTEQEHAIELEHQIHVLEQQSASSKQVEYRINESADNNTSWTKNSSTNQSRLQRMNEFKNNARQ